MPGRASAVTAPPGFVVANAFPGVTFQLPVQIVFLPDGRKLVAEEGGRVWVMRVNGTRVATPFVDLQTEVLSRANLGLLSIAIDPDFAVNRWVYLLYTVDPDGDGLDTGNDTFGRLTRYQASIANPDLADLSTRQVLIGATWSEGIPSVDESHSIGALRFASDGSLLVSTGDGAHFDAMDAGGLDPGAFGVGKLDASEDIGAFRSLSLNSLAGKILRVDKDTGLGLPSNPFWDGDPASERSRVWIYGVRNPYRFAIRPGSGSSNPVDADPGTLYIGDVGWQTYEEVNIAPAGGMCMGWPCNEGPLPNGPYTAATSTATPNPNVLCAAPLNPENPTAPTGPVLWWTRVPPGANSNPLGWIGNASIGGAFYTGSSYPAAYHGSYLFADHPKKWIRRLEADGNDQVVSTAYFLFDADTPVDLTTDPVSGDLFFVSWGMGQVFRVRYVGTLTAAPTTVDFGNVLTAGNELLQVQLEHPGAGLEPPIQVFFVGLTGDAAFSLPSPPTVPFVLNPGDPPSSIGVRFDPTVLGAHSGLLSIVHSGTNSPLQVPLSGTGVSGLVSVGPITECATPAHPCVSVPIVLERSDAAPARGVSVRVQLSPGLLLCVDPETSITQGDWLSGFASAFETIALGGGSYVVDQAILGLPCGTTTGGSLFTLHVRGVAPDGVSTIAITAAVGRGCDNEPLAFAPGAGGTITLDATPPAAIADLAATRLATPGPSPGTLAIAVTFTAPADAASIEVYRAPFGAYPEYDDAGGAPPAAPAHPPGPPWQLTSVTASGGVDAPPARDFWYYAAFSKDGCGNISTAGLSTGTLDYVLGDVHDSAVDCQGDHQVGTSDLSFLGAHYGSTLAPADPRACLDIGPTTDFSATARPTTDNVLDFEDLVVLALTYGQPPAPAMRAQPDAGPTAREWVALDAEPTATIGETFVARVRIGGAGTVHALHAELGFDPNVVSAIGIEAGELLAVQPMPSVVLPSGPGSADVALLGQGSGIRGSGVLVQFVLRRVATGDPGLRLARVDARDRTNGTVELDGDGLATTPRDGGPLHTSLMPAQPNPFAHGTSLALALGRPGRATLEVFDVAGRRVSTLLQGLQPAGRRVIVWDGTDGRGHRVAPGTYVIRLEADGRALTRRVQFVP
jgi:glucose/arabinose dehydrogenase